MANWQYKISIKAIRDSYQDTEDLEALGKAMAIECRQLSERVQLPDDFEHIKDIEEHDDVLEKLYDWGDYEHKCWINVFS